MLNLLFATWLLAAPALAAPPPPPPGGGEEIELSDFDSIASKLGLTDEQREKVRQIVFESNQARIDVQARSQKAEAELRHLLMAETLDEKAITKALDASNAAEAELRKNRVQLAISLRKIVTADQWRQLQDLRRERMKERGGPPGAP